MRSDKVIIMEDRSAEPENGTVAARVIGDAPKNYATKKAIYRTFQVVWYILGVIEALLAFRLLLKLVGANPASPFTILVYNLSYPLAYPFLGLLGTSVAPDGFVFEWSTVIGMLVYVVFAYGIVYLIKLMKPASPVEVEHGVEEV